MNRDYESRMRLERDLERAREDADDLYRELRRRGWDDYHARQNANAVYRGGCSIAYEDADRRKRQDDDERFSRWCASGSDLPDYHDYPLDDEEF